MKKSPIHQTDEERLTSSIEQNTEVVKNFLSTQKPVGSGEFTGIIKTVLVKGDKGEKGDRGEQGERGEQGPTGVAGETPNIDKVANLVQSRINLEKIAKETATLVKKDSPDEMVEKINKSKKKISWKQLKDVPEFAEPDTMNQVGYVGGGGMGDPNLLFNIDNISSQLDGATKTFTIKPNRIVWDIRSSSAPWVFVPTTDYVISGGSRETLTFTSEIDAANSLRAGQTIIVLSIRA